ncbi:hypothetical protein GH714_017640 [Hevea brasiliensis]|uniref:Uncharacterized protein n=1 Tax=Hevea brasiliensis TaxID=3981 RepID=A0A6A6KE18_HEVBR|nr:hypothetical protein GH714_017640 [Hevea brasiliensis]
MYPPSYTQSEFCCDDKSYETTGLDLNLGHIMPDFSVLEDDCTARFDFDETRSHKRVKQSPSATVSNGNGAGLYCTGSNGRTSTNSLNIVPRLHFRDYVLTYTERAVGVLGSPAKTVTTFTAEKDEALRLVYEICPQIQFGHFVANSSILEAFEGKRSVHVVDLGMTLGLPNGQQWRNLIHSIANRTGHCLTAFE